MRLLAREDAEEHQEVLDTFFWRFMSGIFSQEFKSANGFRAVYSSYEQIESVLSPFVLTNMMFTNTADRQLNLEAKVERYKQQINTSELTSHFPPADVFLLALQSWIYQVMDILLTCSVLQLNPYIRNEVSFNYFTLIMHVFFEDAEMKDMIEKAIVFHILHKTIDRKMFHSIAFDEYCKNTRTTRLLQRILERMRRSEIDILATGIQEVAAIIQEESSLLFRSEE